MTNRIPYGLKVIRVLVIFQLMSLLFSVFLFGLAASIAPLLKPLLPSVLAPYMYLSASISFIADVCVLIAISKRNWIAYSIAALGFVASFSISLLQLIGQPLYNLLISAFLFIPPLILLWYWSKLKPYFADTSFNAEAPWVRALDRKVNPFLIGWLILVIVGYTISTIFTLRMGLQGAAQQEKFRQEFEGKSFKERNEYCLSQSSQQERDLCLFEGFRFTKNKENITIESCNLIVSEGLRMTCYGSIGECALITNEAMRTVCKIAPTTSILRE